MELLLDGPNDGAWTIVLAHGAGQGMHSRFMSELARGLVNKGQELGGVRTVRFEFPYMEEGEEGERRPPDGEQVLLARWREVIASVEPDVARRRSLVIGGKSMGGRMASLIADEQQVGGLICLGYPFHPMGKPERYRAAHLANLHTPTLICQGERDPFGGRAEVDTYQLSKKIDLLWLPEGDHSFKPPKRAAHSEDDNFQQVLTASLHFLRRLTHLQRPPRPTSSRSNGVEIKLPESRSTPTQSLDESS